MSTAAHPHSRYPLTTLRDMARRQRESIRRERPSGKWFKFRPAFLRVWNDKCALVTPFSYIRADDGQTVNDVYSEVL